MKITAISRSRHRIGLDPPFPAAWDSQPRETFEVELVRVETDEGLVGIGSGGAMPGFEGHETLFLGRDPRDLARHERIIETLSFHYGRMWPLDIALWDLLGKIEGRPVWRLLGARTARLACYASLGTLKSSDELIEAARRAIARGFPAMKVRFQRPDWREDVAAIEALRAAVGYDLGLAVDANQAWRMPWDARPSWEFKDALAVARALEGLGVMWLEEPLHRGRLAALRVLRRKSPISIAGGEMTREPHELRQMLLYDAYDVLQPDAALIGGISGLKHIAELANTFEVGFTPHAWGDGIQLMANAQLAAGVAGDLWFEWPWDPPGWTPERRDFALRRPLEPGPDGHFLLPETPGLGLELDEKRLEATRI